MDRTFYLCDGKVECCPKNECYKTGGQCCHTEKVEHAMNPKKKRNFIKNCNGDNWEISEN